MGEPPVYNESMNSSANRLVGSLASETEGRPAADLRLAAEDIRRLQAFWAYSQANRVLAPRDGSALDVTEVVMTYADVLARIADLPVSHVPELLPWEWKHLREAEKPADQQAP